MAGLGEKVKEERRAKSYGVRQSKITKRPVLARGAPEPNLKVLAGTGRN